MGTRGDVVVALSTPWGRAALAVVRLTGPGCEAVVSQIASPCLLNELGVDFDRETMPGWMLLPPPGELPDQPFLVDYIRAYARAP